MILRKNHQALRDCLQSSPIRVCCNSKIPISRAAVHRSPPVHFPPTPAGGSPYNGNSIPTPSPLHPEHQFLQLLPSVTQLASAYISLAKTSLMGSSIVKGSTEV
jgi:hypothetical protein